MYTGRTNFSSGHGLRTSSLTMINTKYISDASPNTLAQAVTVLTCIWKMPGSNFGRDAVYIPTDVNLSICRADTFHKVWLK